MNHEIGIFFFFLHSVDQHTDSNNSKWQHMPTNDVVFHISGNWMAEGIVCTHPKIRTKKEHAKKLAINVQHQYPFNKCVALRSVTQKSDFAHEKRFRCDCIRSCPKFRDFVCVSTHFRPLGFLAAVFLFIFIFTYISQPYIFQSVNKNAKEREKWRSCVSLFTKWFIFCPSNGKQLEWLQWLRSASLIE